MQALEDIIIALFNPRSIGRTLSKRPVGMIAASLSILVIIYIIVFSMWYSSVMGDFVDIVLDISKPRLPTFSIINGQLSMHIKEPYIITHEDIYEIISEAALGVDRKRFGGKGAREIEQSLQREEYRSGQQQSFCLVMDTTGAYKERIDVQNYSKYAVITKDSMEIVDRVQSMPGDVVPIKERIKEDIRFTPDLADRLNSPMKRFITIAIILGLVIFTPIHLLLKALISAFIVWIIFLIVRREKPFAILYKVSLYALSPIVLLAVVHRLWVPIHGLIFQTIYFIYIIMAILAIPKPEGGVK